MSSVDLHLAGSTGGTQLSLGQAQVSFPTALALLELTSFAEPLCGSVRIASALGSLELSGFSGDATWAITGAMGELQIQGFPGSFAYFIDSVLGELRLDGYPGDAYAGVFLDTLEANLVLTGYPLDISWIRRTSPQYICPGFASDGTTISIPLALLSGVTAEEADAVTGDWREVLQGILLCLDTSLQALPLTHRVKTVRTFKLEDYNARHALLGNGLKRHISVKINITYTHCPSSLADEPPPE